MSEVNAENFDLDYAVLPLECLEEDPRNPNVMSKPVYEQLVYDIKKRGFKDPIIVRPKGKVVKPWASLENRWLIQDGHHRKGALLDLGHRFGPCVIFFGESEFTSDVDQKLSLLMLNKIKGRLDSTKVGALLLGLRESYGAVDLVELTGYSSQDLENYASVLKIPELPDVGQYGDIHFLRYAGGKFTVRHKLIGSFPVHKVYCEVFGGGGHVLLNKPPAKVDVYNDLDGKLVNLFEVVRNQFPEFKEKFNGLLYSSELYKKFVKQPTVKGNPVESAVRFFFILRSSFAGFQSSAWGYSREGNQARGFWNGFEDLKKVWERLQNVNIDHLDFRKVIKRWDSPDTVFFIDPPYYGIDYYSLNFKEQDHHDLHNLLVNAVVGKWCLIYNNVPEIRKLYHCTEKNGLHWRLASSPLNMPGNRGLESAATYSNLVIFNYKPEEAPLVGSDNEAGKGKEDNEH